MFNAQLGAALPSYLLSGLSEPNLRTDRSLLEYTINSTKLAELK